MTDLKSQLTQLGRLLRLTAALRGLLWWLLLGGIISGGLAIAARLGAPAYAMPTALAVAGVCLLVCLLRPLTAGLRRRQVAALIERHDPSLRELVLSATELAETSASQHRYSHLLTSAVISQAEQAVASVPRADLLGTRRLRPLALLAAISLAFGLSLTLIYQASLADMLQVTVELPAVRRLVHKALPLPEPVLSGLRLQITPPQYTGLPTRLLNVGFTSVKAPAGSCVTLSAAVPATGRLSLQVGKRACKFAASSDRATYAFTLTSDTIWRMAVEDSARTVTRQGRLRIVTDLAPTVRITYPRRNLILDVIKPIKLSAIAGDDYGLTELALEYLLPDQKRWQQIQLGAAGQVQRVEYEWDLAPLDLQPGQSVAYRFMARDNNLFTGPKTGYSPTYRVTLADRRPQAAHQRLEEAREQQGEALQQLRDQAQQIEQQLQALQQQMQQGQQEELTAQQRAELQQAAAQLQKQAENLRQALAQAEQEVQQSGQSSPELSRKMEEINRLLNETLDKQLKQAIQQLQQAAQGSKPNDLPQTLEQAQKAQQELMQRLDQMLALLQQAKQEGDLAALRQEVEKLAARQQALIGERDKLGDFQRQSRDQKDLGRDTQSLPEKVERLAEQAAGTKNLADKLQKIADALRQSNPAGQMQQASQSLHASQPQQAAPAQQQALQALQQAATDLAGAQADVYSQTRQELQQATAQLVASGLYLSQQQEKLSLRTQPYEGNHPEQMMHSKRTLQQFARQQHAISAGSRRVAQRLGELVEKSPMVDPSLVQQAMGVGSMSTQAERDLAGGAIDAALQSQESVTVGLNQLVQKLLQSEQQFQQASAQMALQEYMKRLQQMAGQQRGLNQRTQQMGGGQPQPMPGGQQAGQMPGGMQSGGIGALADQQAALRQALQKMLGQAGNQGGLGNQLGGVPGQMDDVEKDLRGQNVTQETHRRQQDILHKMLDAQRSLYQKDREERQRKAEAPKPYQRPTSPPALRQTLTQKPPPALNAPQRDLPLGYEDLTRKYFEALGRR